MAKIEIPERLRSVLGAEMKMDVHWVDVQLADGTKLFNLVVRGSRYITGRANDANGEGALQFQSEDIARVRRRKSAFWPFW